MTEFRRILGNPIWILQTQFSVAFLVTRFATSIAYRNENVHDISAMVALANKIIRRLTTQPTVLHYVPLFDSVPNMDQILELELFSFSDCGYATLHLSRSIESQIIVVGRPLQRDGDISLQGRAIDFSRHKISRATRSTVAGEAVALANAIDSGISAQAMMMGIFFGRVPCLYLNERDPYPLTTPFQLSPDLDRLRQKIVDGDAPAFIDRQPSVQEWDRGGSPRSNLTALLTKEEKGGT